MNVFEDNMPTIRMIKSLGGKKRRKFIDIRHHDIVEKVAKYNIKVQYVKSAKQRADILTKILRRTEFKRQRA